MKRRNDETEKRPHKKILQDVCYNKQFQLSLHPIRYNYGKEYIRKDDAEGFDPVAAAHGRTDYAGTQAQASFYAKHSRQGNGNPPDRL